MSEKRVYFFGDGEAEGRADMRNLLGGKGANLAEMTRIGVPVPPGFTITTEECTAYQQTGQLSAALQDEVREVIARCEKVMGKTFADAADPLLFSVRSGARVSMPGMMDTVLNLGLNDETLQGLIEKSGNERFAYDSYRRLIQMYGDVVLGVDAMALRASARMRSRKNRPTSTPTSPSTTSSSSSRRSRRVYKEQTRHLSPGRPQAALGR